MTSTPKPEVVYLPAIFRDIRRGVTRAPAFQRGFVWTQRQVLELLESVYKSYPIGSLLFWHVGVDQMRTDNSPEIPLPHPEVTGTVDFILDGMQRVSSLFGAFHAHAGEFDRDPFDVIFDLYEQVFRHASDCTPTSISLRVLFSPKDLLAEQARLGGLPGGEQLVERSLELQRAFQEYLLPVVRIGDRPPSEVVEIFERVNSTGTRLGAVDFMRALTWSSTFDLSEQLEELSNVALTAGYTVPTDTLAKLIALKLGIIPTGSEMLKLRGTPPDQLQQAARDTMAALKIALKFLSDRLHFLSYDYLPYEGQFLVIASLAASVGEDLPGWLSPWVWRVSFSETMAGRPDHAIARLALNAGKDPNTPLDEIFSLASEDLRSRTVRKGGALSMAIVAAMATAPARSVFTGAKVTLADSMSGYDAKCLAAIYSKEELDAVMEPTPRGTRLIANIILLDPSERRPGPAPGAVRDAILFLAKSGEGIAALETQCINAACVEALNRHEIKAFLDERAKAMLDLAARLSGVTGASGS